MSTVAPLHNNHSQQSSTDIDVHSMRKRDRSVAPLSTYRLQFNKSFTFSDARRIVNYLARLGISHCYASPFLKARNGSQHGYDIVDHTAFNPEIGTEAEFRDLVAELHQAGMGLILDFVPNHMAVATNTNEWWSGVLEDGPSSPFASYFDIDWMPLKPDLANKVLLPVLGDQFGRVLENGELVLKFEAGIFWLQYYDRRFPISVRSTAMILKYRLDVLIERLGAESPLLSEYQSILTAIGHLPARSETDPVKTAEGRREKDVIRRRLNSLCQESPELLEFLTENVRQFNGAPDDPRSFDQLDQLLLEQSYRLSYWRIAADEINYRRFFDVNELAAIRIENPDVFAKAHELTFRLLEEGLIDGLRVDHPDGLYDPLDYFSKVAAAGTQCRTRVDGDGEGDGDGERLPEFYFVVEKILGRGERLPEEWPVHGTTGYDFLNAVNGLFVDRNHLKEIDAIYSKFTRERIDFKALAYRCKKLIMDASMSSEIHVLGHELDRISEQDRLSRDFTLRSLTDAIREVIACFPVYRTYITRDNVPERDQRFVELAVVRAKRLNPAVSESIFDFVKDILLCRFPVHLTQEDRDQRQRFVSRFQQVTSPVMAKGIEDTAFYIANRLVSLNEVGGDPDRFGLVTAAFHQQNMERQAHWPHSLLASSTHDTKRSEDVRARINVISELPNEWRAHLFRWCRINQRAKKEIDGELVPSRNDEYLLYQTLIGTWPFELMAGESPEELAASYIQRIQDYMLKASREAKVHTSWISPHLAYEQAMHEFVDEVLNDSHRRGFLSTFVPFAQEIAEYGLWNSLSQTLLKLTCPGVPDTYQGTELFEFKLVDPDNRRPIDFELRESRLMELERLMSEFGDNRHELIKDLINRRHDGTIKLYVLWRILQHRRAHPRLYASGHYIPLTATGACSDNVCAFARSDAGHSVIVIVPRFLSQMNTLAGDIPASLDWNSTAVLLPESISGKTITNLLTGDQWPLEEHRSRLRLDHVLQSLPLALLEIAEPGATT